MNASFSWTKNVHLPEGKFYGSAIYASKVNLTLLLPFIMRMERMPAGIVKTMDIIRYWRPR